ncbi:syntaxin-2-like [Oncorhynchus tshawytscha]|uniref:syntaxin-2-like n=1 Tax=Oncorhynchus tshawytscha TaxID=74940 RepID=UPI000D0A19B6|nr:syntaxin-2-like [Oncorhynchus tshawytscha]
MSSDEANWIPRIWEEKGIILDSQITRQAENEIESGHQDIFNLESSIRELHAMFMAMLVENQGDMVNNIEKNVSNAAKYIGRAKEETKKAEILEKKIRQKLFIFGFVLLILHAVIALIVGLSVGLTNPLYESCPAICLRNAAPNLQGTSTMLHCACRHSFVYCSPALR